MVGAEGAANQELFGAWQWMVSACQAESRGVTGTHNLTSRTRGERGQGNNENRAASPRQYNGSATVLLRLGYTVGTIATLECLD
jgi:hypothetical protein